MLPSPPLGEVAMEQVEVYIKDICCHLVPTEGSHTLMKKMAEAAV